MTELIGILNITPDSFSDGGKFLCPNAALAQAEKLITDGASVIDIGAQSTRPGAILLSAEEEWERLSSILPTLCKLAVPISIDTFHASVAKRAIDVGVSWINDVSAGSDPAMLPLIAHNDVFYVFMHNLGIPANKSMILPEDKNPTDTIIAWAKEKILHYQSHSISTEKLIVDPGIGFGKTAEQSLTLLKNIPALQSLNLPLLIGHSRKSFLSLVTDKAFSERDEETAEFSQILSKQGVAYLRVHNVAVNKKALCSV